MEGGMGRFPLDLVLDLVKGLEHYKHDPLERFTQLYILAAHTLSKKFREHS
jgi:hypothetical protein